MLEFLKQIAKNIKDNWRTIKAKVTGLKNTALAKIRSLNPFIRRAQINRQDAPRAGLLDLPNDDVLAAIDQEDVYADQQGAVAEHPRGQAFTCLSCVSHIFRFSSVAPANNDGPDQGPAQQQHHYRNI